MHWRTTILIGAVVLMFGGGYVFTDWYVAIPDDAPATYVGRQTCVQCHQQESDLHHGSHHDLAMDRATDTTVLANFDDQTLESFGITSRFYRDGEKFMVRTEGPDGELSDFQVKYVFGVEPLQQYMIEFDRPDGMPEDEIARLQVLSLCWDTTKKEWFQLQPPDVPQKIEPGDPLHWTGRTQCWNTSCADCHSTNLQKNFDLETLTYHTTFSEIDVSCEACHGPGSQHVELANSWSMFWDRRQGYGLAQLKGEDTTAQIETCAKCHSRRGEIQEGFCGGERFHDYYSNELLTEQTYHDDGQIKDEVYVYGSFLQSKMYHEGIRCTDCHDPHSTKVKFEGNELCTSCHAHSAGKYDSPNHHRHAVGSKGSLCVECHMPATTYMHVDPRRDHSLRVPRPDLSVKHGTPNSCTQCHINAEKLPDAERKLLSGKQYLDWLTEAKQNPVVAAELARLDQWSQDYIEEWYGTKNQTPHFAETFSAIRKDPTDSDAYDELRRMLSSRKTPDIVRGTAALEMTRNAEALQSIVNRAFAGTSDQPSPALQQLKQEDAVLALQGLLQSVETEISAILNATWKYETVDAAGRPRTDSNRLTAAVEPYVLALFKLHSHPRRLIRIEAARILTRIPSTILERLFDSKQLSQHRQVFDELVESIRTNQERGSALLALGSIYELKSDVSNFERYSVEPQRVKESDRFFELARQAYRDAIRVAPNESGARGNLAAMNDRLIERARLELQRLQRARTPATSPEVARQIERLQQLEEENARLRKAELAVLANEAERAIQSQVGAPVIDRYAMALYLDGQLDECERQLRQALTLAPEDPTILLHYTLILEKQQKFKRALEFAKKLLEQVPDDPSYKRMRDNLARQAAAQ